MSLELDTKEFEWGFKKLTGRMILNAETGMGKAAMQLMNDAVMEEPTVPHKEGYLRGSGSVFVGNEFKGRSRRGKNGKENTELSESIPIEEIRGTVGFNTPYAKRWHEAEPGTVNFSEPSAGPKYLEKKMNANKDIYYNIINNEIKKNA